MFCKDQLRLIFSKCLRGKGQHEYQDLDPKLWKRAFWLGTFPSQNCQELMEQVTGLEMLKGLPQVYFKDSLQNRELV